MWLQDQKHRMKNVLFKKWKWKNSHVKRAENENILEAVNNKKQFTIRKNVGNAVGATSSDGYLVVFAAVTARTKDRDQSSRKGQAGMYE